MIIYQNSVRIIVVRSDSEKKTFYHYLIILSQPTFTPLHLVMLIFFIVDCVSLPCKNGGFCQTFSSGEIKCHCQNGFWGKFCENGENI